MNDRPLITYNPIHDTPEEHARWREEKCPFGWHLFDEVRSLPSAPAFGGSHYLHCDACGLEVHIAAVIVPTAEEREDVATQKRSPQWTSPSSRLFTPPSRTS